MKVIKNDVIEKLITFFKSCLLHNLTKLTQTSVVGDDSGICPVLKNIFPFCPGLVFRRGGV